MENESKNAILAIVLSAIVLFGWNYFFPTPTYVPSTETVASSETSKTNTTTNNTSTTSVNQNLDSLNPVKAESVSQTVDLFFNEDKHFTLNNYLEVVWAKSLNSKEFYPDVYKDITSSLKLNNGSQFDRIFFNFKKLNENTYEILSLDEVYFGKISVDGKGELTVEINSKVPFKYEFVTRTEKIEIDSFSKRNQYFVYSKELEAMAVGDDENLTGLAVKWYGVDFDYHFFATVFPEKSLFDVTAKNETLNNKEFGKIILNSATNVTNKLVYKNVFLQKNYDDLLALGNNLDQSVDFGIWEIIAVPILRGLQMFFNVFPNWGVAIILLTIFIRMLTFPLQYKSFKSMKKMQVIQPELTKIREKYKDNPQKMQQETMALFKKAGANPLGGCLPLLLQMPIFFAFYKVLYSSVELVDAPFIFWIKDLSEMDPYYVLPILMSLAMFLNMKLTPSASADPTQQKIMMFMPLIFGVMMASLPAGLTLYILISTIMGMLQQLFVYKRVN